MTSAEPGLVLLTADKTRLALFALPPGETHERTLSWFDWSLLQDMSPDGKTVIFSETGEAVGTHYSMFLRKTDGSPAVRLGDGGLGKLSPDGKWVLAEDGSPAKLTLLPTGVGQPKAITDDKINHFNAAWVPDGKSIVFTAAEPGHGRRTYIQGIDAGSPPRPITPEGVQGSLVSPDNVYLLATDAKRDRWLYPLAGGGEPKKLAVSLGLGRGHHRLFRRRQDCAGARPRDSMQIVSRRHRDRTTRRW